MVVWPLRNQGVLDRGKEMTSRSSPWAKNVWSKLPEKQSGLPRSLRSLARTSGPLRFKKNDVLGRAYPSASRKMTFWDERTPPLPYYKAETSKFIAFLFVYWMKRWLQLQKSRQLHWQNSIMQNMERLWTPEKLKKILKAVQGLFFIWRGKYG